jgi:hypothetical protein
MGFEYGFLTTSPVTVNGQPAQTVHPGLGLGGATAQGSTSVFRFTGEVCAVTYGTKGELTQIFYHIGTGTETATSVLGIDCSAPFWEEQLAAIDISVNWGLRYRYHSHFVNVANTYASLPISVTFSKEVLDDLTPYVTFGVGPIGLMMKDKYGQYNAFEAGLLWKFAKNLRATVVYSKAHDEAKLAHSTLPYIYQYDSTMTTAGIQYYW